MRSAKYYSYILSAFGSLKNLTLVHDPPLHSLYFYTNVTYSSYTDCLHKELIIDHIPVNLVYYPPCGAAEDL